MGLEYILAESWKRACFLYQISEKIDIKNGMTVAPRSSSLVIVRKLQNFPLPFLQINNNLGTVWFCYISSTNLYQCLLTIDNRILTTKTSMKSTKNNKVALHIKCILAMQVADCFIDALKQGKFQREPRMPLWWQLGDVTWYTQRTKVL